MRGQRLLSISPTPQKLHTRNEKLDRNREKKITPSRKNDQRAPNAAILAKGQLGRRFPSIWLGEPDNGEHARLVVHKGSLVDGPTRTC